MDALVSHLAVRIGAQRGDLHRHTQTVLLVRSVPDAVTFGALKSLFQSKTEHIRRLCTRSRGNVLRLERVGSDGFDEMLEELFSVC